MISFFSFLDLLKRSYAFALLEEYVDRYDQVVRGSIDFSLLSERQEAFDHCLEVFEQDLRLGEESSATLFCRKDPSLVLKAYVMFALVKGQRPLASNVACAGWELADANELAKEWLTEQK